MTGQTIRLVGPRQREYAARLLQEAPDGYVMKIGEETRRDAQNRRLWAMAGDIQAQVESMAKFSKEDIKNRFMHALGVEMRFLPELEGAGMFPVGLRSSNLTVAQFSALIELMFEYGARNNVVWSEKPY